MSQKNKSMSRKRSKSDKYSNNISLYFTVVRETDEYVEHEASQKRKKTSFNNSPLDNIFTVSPFKELIICDKWKDFLKEELASNKFCDYIKFVEKEEKCGKTIFPPTRLRFEAFNLCPPSKVKVVILGQDPYHGFNQADGLSFSVQKGTPQPPSLKNILKEAVSCVGIRPTKSGSLRHWAEQGVLLLNTVLTVEKGLAGSHFGKGCEQFTDDLIKKLNCIDRSLVFLLWGKAGQDKRIYVNEERHRVFVSSHPSPLGATKTTKPFLGSRCFLHVNNSLLDAGEEPIDWNVQ